MVREARGARALCALAEALADAKRALEAKQAVTEARGIVDAVPQFKIRLTFSLSPPLTALARAYCKIGESAKPVMLKRKPLSVNDFYGLMEAGTILPVLAEARDFEAITAALDTMKEVPSNVDVMVFLPYADLPYTKVFDWVHLCKNPRLRLTMLATIAHQYRDPVFREKFVSSPPIVADRSSPRRSRSELKPSVQLWEKLVRTDENKTPNISRVESNWVGIGTARGLIKRPALSRESKSARREICCPRERLPGTSDC